LIYSNSESGSRIDGLLSGNPVLYNRTFSANPPSTITQTGKRYLYAKLPPLTPTVLDNPEMLDEPAKNSVGNGYPLFRFLLSDPAKLGFEATADDASDEDDWLIWLNGRVLSYRD
jgi:hypothetical protein